MTAALAAVEQPKKDIKVMPARCQEASYARTEHRVVLESGIDKEQVLDPAFWSLVAARFRPYDHVEVLRDDETLYGELLVMQASKTYAVMHILRWESINKDAQLPADADLMRQYEVAKQGPHLKWCVIRKSDRQRIFEGKASHEEAMATLRAHASK